MYYMRRTNTIYRDYGEFGYITDNRNFEYRLLGDNHDFIGDRIVSSIGNIFLSELARKPISIDQIVERMHSLFLDTDRETLRNDAIEFYEELIDTGFVVKGNTTCECYNNADQYQRDQSFDEMLDKRENAKKNIVETEEFFGRYFPDGVRLTHLHIEIVSQCNERCVHCYIPHALKNDMMDKNLFYNILEQAMDMKVLNLTISGGEPMIHPSFVDFLKKSNEYNFSVNILSNLTMLSDEILNEIKKNPLISIQTSIYSMNPEIHDAITCRQGSWLETIESVLKLKASGVPIQISCPVIQQNKDEYIDVINWGKEHNIKVNSDYVIIGQYNCSDENLDCRLTYNDVYQYIVRTVHLNKDYIKHIEKEVGSKNDLTAEDNICSVCRSSICISERGVAYPCAGWQNYVLGDLKETTLENIWNNSEKTQFLRNIKRKDFPQCLVCAQKEFCTMCMVRNANESSDGNPFEINKYFCKVVELNKEVYQQYKENITNE